MWEGFIGKFDFRLLKSGVNLKQENSNKIWKWCKNTIMIGENNNYIDIRQSNDMDKILSAMLYDFNWYSVKEDK